MMFTAKRILAQEAQPEVKVHLAGPQSASVGNTVNYDLKVTNSGIGPALNVSLQLKRPDGLIVALPVGPIAAGSELLRTLDFTVPLDTPHGQILTYEVTVGYGDTSGYRQIASDSASTQIIGRADLGITSEATPNPATPGITVTYMMHITNAGPSIVKQVELVDALPPTESYESDTNDCLETSLGVLHCDVGQLNVGETRAITIYTRVDEQLICNAGAPVALVNRVSVKDTEIPEVNAGNNEIIVETRCEEGVSGTTTLSLLSGWNLIAFEREPTDSATSAVMAPVADRYSAVLSFDREPLSFYPDIPNQYNTLRSMDPYHGYWIRTATATFLPVKGMQVSVDTSLQLQTGWNLVGYLPVTSQPIATALSSIAGQYSAVLGYDGGALSAYPELPDISTLQTLEPRHGYWIKMNQPGTLVYTRASASTTMAASGQMNAPQIADGVTPTNQWVDFYSLDCRTNGRPVPVGVTISAYDPNGVKVGQAVVSRPGRCGLLAVYGDDPLTTVDEGAQPGDVIAFYINGHQAIAVGPDQPVWTSFGDLRQVNLDAQYPIRQVKLHLPLIHR
jgi:uncharacterized repeat protein (TIGR01451 family)